jgi:3D (Asp-Asp-Asp) domain-containing protein
MKYAPLFLVIAFAEAATAAIAQRPAGESEPLRTARAERPAPGTVIAFTATAYCQDGVTRSGAGTHSGVAAADPAVLPVGSVVQIAVPDAPDYGGVYTVLDTGSLVQRRSLDLFVRNCAEATAFGRKLIDVKVLRRGWSPRESVKR